MALINKIDVAFDYDYINKNFDIYQITTSDKYIAKGAYFLDKPSLSLKSLSVVFDYGRTAFAMFSKGKTSKMELIDVLGNEKLFLKQSDASELKNYILFRLFLYSLGNYQSEERQFNNLTGKFYYAIEEKKNNIVTLCIDVDKEMNISADAATFTKLSVFKKKKETIDVALPKYLLEDNGKMRRVLSSDNEESIYIKKGVIGRKSEVPFLSLKSEEIRNTRAFCLNKIVDMLNERYSESLNAHFESIDIEKTECDKRDYDFVETSKNIVLKNDISVIDFIKDPIYTSVFEATHESLEKALGKNIIVSSKIEKNTFNIVFLHDKDFYKNDDDPYKAIKRDEVVQCITLEDSSQKIIDDTKAVLNTVFKELVIKNDILNTHKISLDNWEEFHFKDDWVFGIEKDEIQHYMVIHKDGTFEFESEDVFFKRSNNHKISALIKCINDSDSKGKSIVMSEKGDIVLLSRTNTYCLPNPEIYKLKTISRSSNDREKFLSGILDINLFSRNDVHYYSAGLIGKGMNTGIPKASLLYKIEVIKGENIMPMILEMMSVLFVKYNSFTILPYPFKYLREYINIIGTR